MADELGATVSQLNHYENGGRTPNPDVLEKFAEKCAAGVFKIAVSVPKDGEAGRQMKAAREAAGLTQQQMAVELGMKRDKLSSYENGAVTPKPDVWANFVEKCASGAFKIGVGVPKDGEAGRQMKAAREAAGLTMQQMADELGIKVGQLNGYENGGNAPTPDVWMKFVEKCDAGVFKIGVSVPKDGEAGRQMKAAREAAGLTQQQMADELGIHTDRLSHYENGSNFPPHEVWGQFVDKCAAGVFKIGVRVPEDGEAGRQMRAAREAAGLTQQQMADELGISLFHINGYENTGNTPKPDVWARFNVLYFAGRFAPTGKSKAQKSAQTSDVADVPTPRVVVGPQASEILENIKGAQAQFEAAIYAGTPEENQAQRTQLRNEMNKQFADLWGKVESGELVLNDAERDALRQAELEFVFSKIYNPAAKNLIPGYGAALNQFMEYLRVASQVVDPIARGFKMDVVIASFTRRLNMLENSTDEATRRADANERKGTPKAEPSDAEKGPVEARYPERMSPADAIAQLQDIMANIPGNGEYTPKLEGIIGMIQVVEGKLDDLQSRVVNSDVPVRPQIPESAPLPVLSKEQQAERVELALFKLDDFKGMSDPEKAGVRQLIIDLYTKYETVMKLESKNNKLTKVEFYTNDRSGFQGRLKSASEQSGSLAYNAFMVTLGGSGVYDKSSLQKPSSELAPTPDVLNARKAQAMQGLVDGFETDAKSAEAAAERAANAGDDIEFEKQLAESERLSKKAAELRAQLAQGDFSAIDNNVVSEDRSGPPTAEDLRDYRTGGKPRNSSADPFYNLDGTPTFPMGDDVGLFDLSRPIDGQDLSRAKYPQTWPIETISSTQQELVNVGEAKVETQVFETSTVYVPQLGTSTLKDVLSQNVAGFDQMSEVEQKAIAKQVFDMNIDSANAPRQFKFARGDGHTTLSLNQPLTGGVLTIPRSQVQVVSQVQEDRIVTRKKSKLASSVAVYAGVDTDGSEAMQRSLAGQGIDAEVKTVDGKTKIYPKSEQSAQAVKERFGDKVDQSQIAVDGKPGETQTAFELGLDDTQMAANEQQSNEQKVVEAYIAAVEEAKVEALETVSDVEDKQAEWLAEFEANKNLPKNDVPLTDVVSKPTQQQQNNLSVLVVPPTEQDGLKFTEVPEIVNMGQTDVQTDAIVDAPTDKPDVQLNIKGGKANLAQVIDGEVTRKGLYATLLDDTAAWISFSADAKNPLNSVETQRQAEEVAAYYKQKVIMLGGMSAGMKLIEKAGELLAKNLVPGAAVATKTVTMGAEVEMTYARYLKGEASWTQVWTTTVAAGLELGVTIAASGAGLPGGAAGELARVIAVEAMKAAGVPENQAPTYGILGELIKAGSQGNTGAQKVLSKLLGQDQTADIERRYKQIHGQ